MLLRRGAPAVPVAAALWLAASALAVTPYDVLMTIPYGRERGMLDTSLVEADDPERDLVVAYQVQGDTTYVLPRIGGRDSLWCFVSGRLSGTLPIKGISDFLVLPDGTFYGVSFGFGTDCYAWVFRQTPGAATETVAILQDEIKSRSYLDRLQVLDGGICLTNPHELKHTVLLGSSQLPSKVLAADIGEGIPTRAGPIWLNTLFVMRGSEPILDLGLGGGDLVWVFDDGGFVIGRGTVCTSDGDVNEVFEYYDPSGRLSRRVVTFGRLQDFNAERPYIFAPDHIYQLVFNDNGGELVRYRGEP